MARCVRPAAGNTAAPLPLVNCRFWLCAGLLLLAACRNAPPVPSATPPVTAERGTTIYFPLSVSAAATPPPPTLTLTPAPTPTPPCSEPGRVVQEQLSSQRAGAFSYRIFYPPCYGQDGRTYPVLYLLPGNIHNDAIWDELGMDETAAAAITAGQIPPLLIVMADGGWLANNTSGGPGSYEGLILYELIPHVEATSCAWADPAARAIGGLSRGGYWALEIAFRHPGLFAGVGGHSAALLDTYAGPELNPRYTGVNRELGELHIYLDIGRDDYVIYPLQQLHLEMEEAGVPHTWILNEGVHEETYWQSHIGDYLSWYATLWPWSRTAYPLCPQEPLP